MPNQKINLTTAEREEYDRAMQRLAILAEASTRDPLPEDFKKRSKSLSINELRATRRPRPVTNWLAVSYGVFLRPDKSRQAQPFIALFGLKYPDLRYLSQNMLSCI